MYVISADLAGYCDSLDLSFLVGDHFLFNLQESANLLNRPFDVSEYRSATESLLRFYAEYRNLARRLTGLEWKTGIPIGALTSRLIANIALSTLDAYLEQNHNVGCYRRYVDDFVIVARVDESEELRSANSILERFLPRLVNRGDDRHPFRLDSDRLQRQGSEFSIQTKKCRVHLVSSSERVRQVSVLRDADGQG